MHVKLMHSHNGYTVRLEFCGSRSSAPYIALTCKLSQVYRANISDEEQHRKLQTEMRCQDMLMTQVHSYLVASLQYQLLFAISPFYTTSGRQARPYNIHMYTCMCYMVCVTH